MLETRSRERPIIPKGYDWKVVVDPTRTGVEPGYFYGRLFRWTDIVPRRLSDEPGSWPPGTEFQHLRTGERVRITYGGRAERVRAA